MRERDPAGADLATQGDSADTKASRANVISADPALTDGLLVTDPTAAALVARQVSSFKRRNPGSADLFGRRPRDANAEAKIQASIVAWVRLVAPDVLIFAIPNGGLRTKAEAARMKWTGVVAGAPDLCVLAPGARTFFIEVKTQTGRLSPDQIAIHDHLVALGSPCAIVRSIDDVRRAFEVWNIPTMEARQ